MKIIDAKLLFALMMISASAFGQTAQKEINEQVWKPFIKGFSEGNTELFMSVHSKDLIRSPRDAKKVYNWDEYYQQTATGNSARKGTLNIELRFTERISNDNQAIDVGIYKTSYNNHPPFYGRFHVVLRKESGVWKILVDMDSSEDGTISEKQFLAAKPMD